MSETEGTFPREKSAKSTVALVLTIIPLVLELVLLLFLITAGWDGGVLASVLSAHFLVAGENYFCFLSLREMSEMRKEIPFPCVNE